MDHNSLFIGLSFYSRLLLCGLAVLGDEGFEDGGDLLLLRAREIVRLLEKLFHSAGRPVSRKYKMQPKL